MTHVRETRARNLYVCHTDLQRDISHESFSHQIERVLFRVSFSYEFLVRVSRTSVMGFLGRYFKNLLTSCILDTKNWQHEEPAACVHSKSLCGTDMNGKCPHQLANQREIQTLSESCSSWELNIRSSWVLWFLWWLNLVTVLEFLSLVIFESCGSCDDVGPGVLETCNSEVLQFLWSELGLGVSETWVLSLGPHSSCDMN